ncbi:transposase [Bradyrhizobium sp. SRL28]|nr:transposase [Bradyrhizobium sp. SRL28]
MRRFVEEADRGQWTLLPECLDDFIDESNPVRVIDVFVGALDLAEMNFEGVEPAATGRPSYHPSVLLKLYIYGYLNRVQSSRRLEREADAMSTVMWLLGRLKRAWFWRRRLVAGLLRLCLPRGKAALPGPGQGAFWVSQNARPKPVLCFVRDRRAKRQK